MDLKKTDSGVCINGFRASGVREGKYGVALIAADAPCECAGVFTRNNMKASPVLLTMEKVRKGGLRAVIANSGNANACVKDGMGDAKRMCEKASRELGIKPENVGVASTGIIGRKLDIGAVEVLCSRAAKELSCSPEASVAATRAIMTTDTREKHSSYEYRGIQIGAICKGAGMISPDMATMLCFITTNADLPKDVLQKCLMQAAEDSFNMLVVDGDMSTNDMVLLLSNRGVKCGREDFQAILNHVTKDLAKQMAQDGEGATKFLEVEVRGAKDTGSARKAAKAIVSSSLVKTAMHGENPNWGRIAAAMGRVIEYDFEKIDLNFESGKESASVVEKGVMKDLAPARKVLQSREIKVVVDLNMGREKATAWGCDLTNAYIKINAEYN